MRVREIVFVSALVLGTTAATATARADAAQAGAAYDAKQYARCADLWLAEAASKKGESVADPLYNAACCYALDGKTDKAFSLLDQSVAAGMRDLDNLKLDSDLVSLHGDARWPRLLASVQSRIEAWEKSLGNAPLRRELLAMVKADQDARKALVKAGMKDPALGAQVEAIDRKNTARLKELVAAQGWPGKSLVGKDGASAMWLMVQHADLDRAFQKLCLGKMELAVKAGEAEAKDYAYLVDRVAVAEKRKQLYGTQFNDKREPQPIEDEAHVDERRKAVGLPSMAAYKQQMLKMYGPPK